MIKQFWLLPGQGNAVAHYLQRSLDPWKIVYAIQILMHLTPYHHHILLPEFQTLTSFSQEI